MEEANLKEEIGEACEWLKEISLGFCYEEVKEKRLPTSANAVKTFKKINNFE